MPIYISLIKWTDQGRSKASSLPERVGEVDKRIQALGGRSIGNWLTIGRFDQISVVEAPDDDTAAKLLMIVQSCISLGTVAILAARAINIL